LNRTYKETIKQGNKRQKETAYFLRKRQRSTGTEQGSLRDDAILNSVLEGVAVLNVADNSVFMG
jgi:hypothetical protein